MKFFILFWLLVGCADRVERSHRCEVEKTYITNQPSIPGLTSGIYNSIIVMGTVDEYECDVQRRLIKLEDDYDARVAEKREAEKEIKRKKVEEKCKKLGGEWQTTEAYYDDFVCKTKDGFKVSL